MKISEINYSVIFDALKAYYEVEEDENVKKIIGYDRDPIGTIAAALDDYRSVGDEANIPASQRSNQK